MTKRGTWRLKPENYDALYREARERGWSDNAMLNEIVRLWREQDAAEKLNGNAVTLLSPTSQQ